MTEKEVESYIESLQGLGSHLGLESTVALCQRLGNPQDDLPFVHIAGTNGKGSVAAMVSESLTCCGYKVGRYISPTIAEYRERFAINGRMMSKKDLVVYITTLKEACDAMVAEGLAHPTPFELETALAFLYFKEKHCDIVVLETGMGGATDATNVVKNTLVAVLTSISLDHVGVLGDTVEAIAQVKCGILKEGCVCVSSFSNMDMTDADVTDARVSLRDTAAGRYDVEPKRRVQQVIEAACAEKHIPLIFAKEKKGGIKKGRKGILKFDYGTYKGMELALQACYQYDNAAVALEVLDVLRERYDYRLPEGKIRQAFAKVSWPARMEKIGTKPDFYIDGAHNGAAARALAKTVEAMFYTPKKNAESGKSQAHGHGTVDGIEASATGELAKANCRGLIYIIGMLKDKDQDAVLATMAPYGAAIITVKPPHNDRGMSAYELAQMAAKYHPSVTVADSLEEAVEMAHLFAGKDGQILAFGSLSYLGELSAIVKNATWTRRDSHGR